MLAARTDKALISAHLAGESGAFEELVGRHAGMILATCRGFLGAGGDAEDAAQAVFLLLFRKARNLAGEGDLGAWLHRSAVLIARTARRDRLTRNQYEKEATAMRRTEITASEPRSPRTEQAATLDENLDSLPEHYRQALVLCYFEGLSQSQAAGRLGVPESTVANRCARAIDKLRQRFAGRDRQMTAVVLVSLLGARAGAAAIPLPASFIPSVMAIVQGTTVVASAAAMADGAMKVILWAKLKLAAAVLAPLLVAGVGTAITVSAVAPAADSTAPAAAPAKVIAAEKTPRVAELLQALKTAPSEVALVPAHRQVRGFAALTDNELHAAIPLLLEMLADTAELPAAGLAMDGGGMEVRHRANQALAVAAGISLGQFPVGGGLLPAADDQAELDRQASDQLVAAWKDWWAKSKGQPRKDWLSARRAALERAAGNLADPANQVLLGNTLIMMEGAEERSAAGDLLSVLKKAAPGLNPGPAIDATSNPDARLLADAVRVLGALGDKALVPDLVDQARICNTPALGSRTALPRMLALTLNRLTGLNLEAVEDGTGTIKSEAFDAWLKAAPRSGG